MKTKIKNIKPLSLPWQTNDPFLFCMHHRDEYPKGNEKFGVASSKLKGRNPGQDFVLKDGYRMYHGTRVPGFPVHPHRGFETITIGQDGYVDHSDSLGGAGRFGAGDAQWMTAGSGIQHSEMFPLLNQDSDNPFEIFQIWLNLPAKSKFVKPYFSMLWRDTNPKLIETDPKGHNTFIEIYAGTYKSEKAPKTAPDSWAANPENGVSILTIKMEANAEWNLPAAKNPEVSRTLYFYKGDTIQVDDETIIKNYSFEAAPEESLRIVNGNSTSYFLLLQGAPIKEPVLQHGPFVMNTEEEIRQTFTDYRKTQFGGWPWPEIEQVHGKNKGRFALYEDGTEENKEL